MESNLINISEFPKRIFWNYSSDARLDESIIIEHVILYGELAEYEKLLKLVSKDSIRKVAEKIGRDDKYKKRINFVEKVILN